MSEKCISICIKCKINDVKKTGSSRYFNLCPSCYHKSEKKVLLKKNNGNSNSVYWKKAAHIKAKTKFRAIAMRLLGSDCMKCRIGNDRSKIEVDHILPVSLKPNMEFSLFNVQILCKSCNIQKSNKDFTDYRTYDQKKRIALFMNSISKDHFIHDLHKKHSNMVDSSGGKLKVITKIRKVTPENLIFHS